MGRQDQSYLRQVAPSSVPRVSPGTNSGDISSSTQGPPHPGGPGKLPPNPCPRPRQGARSTSQKPGLGTFVGAPDAQPTRAPPGTLTCRELALGGPQKRPRGEEQEGHKSRHCRRRRRRRIHVEFERSFKQLCKELQGDGCEIHDGAGSWASRAQGGESTAARQHFFLLRRNQTTSGAKASPAPPAGRSRSSPCSAEAAPVSQELLCSGRDGGGAWGDVAPRAPGASEECGLGLGLGLRAAAASCLRDARQPRPRAPCPAPLAAFVRRLSPDARGRSEAASGKGNSPTCSRNRSLRGEFVNSVAGFPRSSAGDRPQPPQERCPGVMSPRLRSHQSGCR